MLYKSFKSPSGLFFCVYELLGNQDLYVVICIILHLIYITLHLIYITMNIPSVGYL
jgi:hypothetical protein